jgi:hypothetical protein
MGIALATYEAPAFTVEELDEVELVPAIIAAVAAALGVEIAFVTFVCTACGWHRCTSYTDTIQTVWKWMLPVFGGC